MEKKKSFEQPEATIVTFINEDIIASSGGLSTWYPGEPGDHDTF